MLLTLPAITCQLFQFNASSSFRNNTPNHMLSKLMGSLFPLTLKPQSSFHPLFHFNTLTPTFTSPCSQSQSNTTTNPHNSQPNPSWVSFPFTHFIKKVAALTTHNRVSNENQQGSCCYLQNGGLGVALLSVTANAKVKISPFVATLASNPTFVSGLFAWFVAQSIKVFLNFCMERKWDLRLMFASGGMPSSHSALCTALTTSVALSHGVADSLFPVSLGFSLIVMYDAIGVRRHAGMQAQVLNMIVADMFQGHPISERKLKELLGHTPSQVFAGALLGCLVACLCCQGCVLVG